MLWLVIGVILTLVALGMIVAGNVKWHGTYSREDVDIPLRWIGVAVAAVGGLFILLACLYTQDPGEVILVRSPGGSIVRTDTSSGWGLTAPWNKRTTFSTRNQRIEMFTNRGGDGDDGAAISAPLKNGSNVDVSITVQVDLQPSKIDGIYRKHRSQDRLWDNVLKPGLRDQVRRETAGFDPFEVKQRRGELVTAIQDALSERWEREGVTVNNVDLGDLKLDAATEKALTAANAKQIEVEQARSSLEKARVEAEVTKTNAKAQTDADQIVRCGADVKTVKQEVAGKQTDVVVVTPKVGAACENRLNEQVLIANWIEALQKMAEKGNLIVVPENFSGILNTGK